MNRKILALLSVAHLVTDVNQGALPALLPFFKESLNLSYTLAGVILLFGNISSSVIQPAFGYISDKHPTKWFLIIAPLIASLGLALTGLAPSYLPLLICVIVSGAGIAGFHPEGYKTAHFFTGEKKATGMAIFSVGGNLGMALGPIFALALIQAFGPKGTAAMVVPGILMAGALLLSPSWKTPSTPSPSAQKKTEKKEPLSAKTKRSMTYPDWNCDLQVLDSTGSAGLHPVLLHRHLERKSHLCRRTHIHVPDSRGCRNAARRASRGSLGPPHVSVDHHDPGCPSAPSLLQPEGADPLCHYRNHRDGPDLHVFRHGCDGQTLLPQRLGMASGLMVGFSVGTGGVGVTLLGVIADAWGVPAAMNSMLILPILGFILSLLVDYPPKRTDEVTA